MGDRGDGPLPAEPPSVKQVAQVVRMDPDSLLSFQPGHQLGRRPGSAPGVEQRRHGVEMGGGDRWGPSRTGAVRQGIEPVGQEGAHVLPDGLLMASKMMRDARNAPSRVREPDHLQAVAKAGVISAACARVRISARWGSVTVIRIMAGSSLPHFTTYLPRPA